MRKLIERMFAAVIFFVPECFGKAMLCSGCLANFFATKQSMVALGVISVVFDLYHSAFVGISFVSLYFLLLITEKFRPILMGSSLSVKTYYSFLILCAAESVNYVLVTLCGGNFDFLFHFLILIQSLIFYFLLESLKEYGYVEK